MSNGDHHITMHEDDEKLDEKMHVETRNKDTETVFDQEDEDIFQQLKKKQVEEKNSSNGQGQGSNPVTKIQKVPDVMEAEKNERWNKYFEPNAIAIGPIHAQSKKVFVCDKELKLMWAAKYLDGLDERKILTDIKHEIGKLMKYLDEKCLDKDKIGTSRDENVPGTLARMLFVDGCAMLQFIYSFVRDDFVKQLKINAAQATVVQQDLFLLENQIPFPVLGIIMNGGKNKQTKQEPPKLSETKEAVKRFVELLIYRNRKAFGIPFPNNPITRRSFRNVQELKAAGIELKPSKSRCLKEVSFSSGLFGGCLRLCPILVDNSTAGKLLNLVAYEMCPDYHRKIPEDSEKNDYRISSYLSFLDSLIDIEQDVKDLRAANILRHRLSCDKDVAELFNSISPNSVADDAYGDVNSKIQDYYEWAIRIWITEFRREHLNSPWRLLALIAAAAALGLTAAQTYFAINPR